MNHYDCKKCGKKHRMGLENMETGNIIPLDLCKECLFENTKIQLYSEYRGTIRCNTSDGRNVNMADELNRLEKEILNSLFLTDS